MIRDFADKNTEKLFNRQRVRKYVNIERVALRKLVMLHSANVIDDLRTAPGNMLELLRGNRAGQYSIRINRQWRICFTWLNGDAYHVEICDYH